MSTFEEHMELRRIWRSKNKARIAGYARAWRQSHPDRQTAHCLVSRAIKGGRLVRQPCERCGAPDVHAHHEDYSRPLEVTFLCRWHHFKRHDELKRAAGEDGIQLPARKPKRKAA